MFHHSHGSWVFYNVSRTTFVTGFEFCFNFMRYIGIFRRFSFHRKCKILRSFCFSSLLFENWCSTRGNSWWRTVSWVSQLSFGFESFTPHFMIIRMLTYYRQHGHSVFRSHMWKKCIKQRTYRLWMDRRHWLIRSICHESYSTFKQNTTFLNFCWNVGLLIQFTWRHHHNNLVCAILESMSPCIMQWSVHV